MPGGGMRTGPGGATGETTLTDGTGLTVGGAANEAPQLAQKFASSLLSNPHTGHFLTKFFPPYFYF